MKKKCEHEWKDVGGSERCFAHCVAKNQDTCDPRAHGGITFRQHCEKCNAYRSVNGSPGGREYGQAFWLKPETVFDIRMFDTDELIHATMEMIHARVLILIEDEEEDILFVATKEDPGKYIGQVVDAIQEIV